MSKPRVLIFSLASLDSIGGAEIAVKELTSRLAGQFEFEVISANLKSFWSKYFYPFWACREAGRRQKIRKYDLVWAIMANQAGMAAARFKKFHPEIPFLLTLQEGDDLDSWAYRIRLWGPKFFRVFQRANQIQAISHYLARWAREMGATCPITVIPNGADLNRFSSSVVSGQTKTEKIIITTSRLVKKNGLDILIKSLVFLPSDVKLWVAGDGPEKMALKRLTEGLKLASRVSFLGQVESSEVSKYLGRATLFARPARSEGLGNAFLEAMMAGLPVIATPVGGIPDFLKEGETGWFCEVNNPKNLAEKVKFILAPENQEPVAQVISKAKKLVQDNYDWDQIAVKMATLFELLT